MNGQMTTMSIARPLLKYSWHNNRKLIIHHCCHCYQIHFTTNITNLTANITAYCYLVKNFYQVTTESTVKLRYNVLLGTGKIGTLHPRYVVTKHSTVHTFISNANTHTQSNVIVTMTSRHCTHTQTER